MCNAFNTAKKPETISLEFPGPDERRLIRRTDQVPVLLPDGAISSMRWGFERKGLGVVNNTRDDNLESPMWRDAIEKRRCLIPLVSYYEWTGSKGHKRTHLFRHPGVEWLVAAGIWEESADLGPCLSMLTTEANAFVSPIHHRMPVLLVGTEKERYLQGDLLEFSQPPDLLIVEDAINPLLKNPPTHLQSDLF